MYRSKTFVHPHGSEVWAVFREPMGASCYRADSMYSSWTRAAALPASGPDTWQVIHSRSDIATMMLSGAVKRGMMQARMIIVTTSEMAR